MKNERTKILGFRVKTKHVKVVNEMVRKFLISKGYNFYEKRKSKVSNLHTQQRKSRQTVDSKIVVS